MNKKIKLILPFPHFLWMIGTKQGIPGESVILHETYTELNEFLQTNAKMKSRNKMNTDDNQ